MVLQLQMHGVLGVYVFSESHSFSEWSIEDDYHCREHTVRIKMKQQCCAWLGTSSCIVCSISYAQSAANIGHVMITCSTSRRCLIIAGTFDPWSASCCLGWRNLWWMWMYKWNRWLFSTSSNCHCVTAMQRLWTRTHKKMSYCWEEADCMAFSGKAVQAAFLIWADVASVFGCYHLQQNTGRYQEAQHIGYLWTSLKNAPYLSNDPQCITTSACSSDSTQMSE